ncbi:carboxy-S-adenosyl-L-methionine synthase CmoA [Halochromatium salexigens]|uniref:Carboxy-S-adenosyl-L-methionine synthase n=1 Tax=Halochromatium salexigens TaxID=49447 RepID=A0AAJ0UGC7_HALSE|nr:carboxy-S-adenosyl-L-methionine synthase CmoA [Halochromatium salexigens]MBK5930971.1 carboxy-S-adenosyl-L-methionine synthase CmoA [Halochromatium salexigens]
MPPSCVDTLYARADAPRGDFIFDERVARVFADMLARSVPGLAELVRLIGLLGARLVQPGTRVYDLGCSLGASSASILARLPPSLDDGDAAIRLYAVDRAPAMLDELRLRLDEPIQRGRLQPICADLADVAIADASLVVLNLTLQFLAPEQRLPLLQRIRAGLRPGGALILAEKVALGDDDALLTQVHADFKAAQGYSQLEIARKRAALEQVLIPDSMQTHQDRLQEAGFTRIEPFFQCLNFVGWVAR